MAELPVFRECATQGLSIRCLSLSFDGADCVHSALPCRPFADGRALRAHNFIPFHTISYHFIPFHTISYHFIPSHTISYHLIPSHTISYHFIPFHTISYHFIAGAQGWVSGVDRLTARPNGKKLVTGVGPGTHRPAWPGNAPVKMPAESHGGYVGLGGGGAGHLGEGRPGDVTGEPFESVILSSLSCLNRTNRQKSSTWTLTVTCGSFV